MNFRLILLLLMLASFSNTWAHSGGFTEERCDKISLPGCTFNWNAIANTDSALYIIGNQGYCYIYYHKGGVKNIRTGITDNLTGIQFINNLLGYIWGENGKILKTTDGGITWSSLTTGVTNNIMKAQFIDANTAFFMANNNLYKTTDGGQLWNLVTLPGGSISFKDFHFFDSQTGQIVGNITSPSISGYVHQTADGGSTWSQLYTDNIAFNKLSYKNNKGYLYGTTTGQPVLLESTDFWQNKSVVYTSSSWSLGSDVVVFNNQTVFITNEQTGVFLYGVPHFLDPEKGMLYSPKNIYTATINGVETLFIIEDSGVYRYTSGEFVCMQLNFSLDALTPGAENPYNIIMPGKKVRFKALISNRSPDTIIRIEGRLKCRSPYVTVTDSVVIYNHVQGSFSLNHYSWGSDEFEIELKENIPDHYIVHLEFSYVNSVPSGHNYHSIFSMPLLFSPFSFSSKTVVDTATENTAGNGNGIFEPEETAQMKVSIKNNSPHYFYNMSATLHSEFSQIAIWNNHARPDGSGAVYKEYSLGFFNPNQVVQPVGDYVFTNNFTDDYVIPFTLSLTGILSEYLDPIGCSYSYFYNINYNWGLVFYVNDGLLFEAPPDSLKPGFVPATHTMSDITEKEGQIVRVFPNPGNGYYKIIGNNTEWSYELLNMLGQPVKYQVEGQSPDGFYMNITNQPNGIYFLKVNTKSVQKTVKIIKN